MDRVERVAHVSVKLESLEWTLRTHGWVHWMAPWWIYSSSYSGGDVRVKHSRDSYFSFLWV